MRYTEQLKSSWGYHWDLFREIWDMFTLHGWRWVIAWLFFLLCVLPFSVATITSNRVGYFVNNLVPVFDSRLPEDINFQLAIKYYRQWATPTPNIPLVINYHYVNSSNFGPMSNVLCVVSVSLLLVADCREDLSGKGREE